MLNLQGDVVGLIDASGEWVAEYTYSAWGEILSITDEDGAAIISNTHIANLNPLRYRGYYYDTETGWYYLQSRYYDPANHRFINADTAEYSAMTAYSLNDTNLFTYCGNNPVNRADDGGEFWNIVIGAVVGAVVGAVTTIVSSVTSGEEIDWVDVAISAGVGAVSGAISATGIPVYLQAGIAASAAFTGTAATEVNHQVSESGWESITWNDVGRIAGKATISGGIAFGMSLIGSGVGKIASRKIAMHGDDMLMRSTFSHSLYTKRQLAQFATQGRKLVNTSKGVSSVVGTLSTWRTNTVVSEVMS